VTERRLAVMLLPQSRNLPFTVATTIRKTLENIGKTDDFRTFFPILRSFLRTHTV